MAPDMCRFCTLCSFVKVVIIMTRKGLYARNVVLVGSNNVCVASCDTSLHDLYYSNQVQRFLNSAPSKELNVHKAIYMQQQQEW